MGSFSIFLKLLGDVKSLSPEKSPIAMKDIKWYTHNSTVGFMVSGMFYFKVIIIFVLKNVLEAGFLFGLEYFAPSR